MGAYGEAAKDFFGVTQDRRAVLRPAGTASVGVMTSLVSSNRERGERQERPALQQIRTNRPPMLLRASR
jgi:hypothetical protein